MSTPLASYRGRLKYISVLKYSFYSLTFLFSLAVITSPVSSAFAQVTPPKIERNLPAPEPVLPDFEVPSTQGDTSEADNSKIKVIDQPDYSRLSEVQERTARLDALFIRLADAADEEQAELVAEEIWAIWLDSGSASVNFVLRRGTAAQKQSNTDLARRMYDQTISLRPDYAEGWARSSRLALEEEDLSRALNEAAKTLTLEPRHFFALWTLGNIFEQLSRNEDAIEAYREANKLHPQLKAVKDRLEALESQLNGDVL